MLISDKLIKSPLNYTGNKFRILNQILPYFPQDSKVFVDLFSGGATVGINVNAEKVIFIDSNTRVISLLKFLANSSFEELIYNLEEKINFYNLSYSNLNGYSHYFKLSEPENKNNGLKNYNKNGFLKLREDYNQKSNKNTDEANLLLYLLLIYGFNNDIRFNSKGEYNLPCGKTDLNKNNLEKLKDFIERSKKCDFEFICGDFRDSNIKDIIYKSDFLYADPPYLITDAVYNEFNGWNVENEYYLLSFLNKCQEKKIPFILSNVLSKDNGKIFNIPLSDWINKNNNIEVVDIDYHYRSASYNKKNRNGNEREIILISENYD